MTAGTAFSPDSRFLVHPIYLGSADHPFALGPDGEGPALRWVVSRVDDGSAVLAVEWAPEEGRKLYPLNVTFEDSANLAVFVLLKPFGRTTGCSLELRRVAFPGGETVRVAEATWGCEFLLQSECLYHPETHTAVVREQGGGVYLWRIPGEPQLLLPLPQLEGALREGERLGPVNPPLWGRGDGTLTYAAYWITNREGRAGLAWSIGAGGEAEFLGRTDLGNVLSLAPSPDGNHWAVVVQQKRVDRRGRRQEDIYVTDAHFGEPRLLVRNGGWPVWTPDGRRVIFRRRDTEVWEVDVKSGQERKIADAPQLK